MMLIVVVIAGSIPACAGEPPALFGVIDTAEVYPRVCGGTVPGGRGRRGGAGSIPACAGEPQGSRPAGVLDEVYPRVCGGTHRRRMPPAAGLGLSPRVRGNRHCGLRAAVVSGSIPACAGEPHRRIIRRPGKRVYPRVCGGTAPAHHPAAWQAGLSPRVRGNLCQAAYQAAGTRSIPACAGEPGLSRCCRRSVWVYPRVCGGTFFSDFPPPDLGSIPACAGEPTPA